MFLIKLVKPSESHSDPRLIRTLSFYGTSRCEFGRLHGSRWGNVVYWFSVAMNPALENAGRGSGLCDAGALWEAEPISSLITCTRLSLLLPQLTGGVVVKAGFFIWLVTVSNGFLLSGTTLWTSALWGNLLNCMCIKRPFRCAATEGNACVVYRPGNSESHFIQTTALQRACRVCLHTNNPSIPMCLPCVNDGGSRCNHRLQRLCSRQDRDRTIKVVFGSSHAPTSRCHSTGRRM